MKTRHILTGIVLLPCWISVTGCDRMIYGPNDSPREKAEFAKEQQARADKQRLQDEAEQAQGKEKRETYLKTHPNLSPLVRKLIEESLIYPDMTTEEVKISWGLPCSIDNIVVTALGRSEVWRYQGSYWMNYIGKKMPYSAAMLVYFYNDKVTMTCSTQRIDSW
jgi:hypothetical protein